MPFDVLSNDDDPDDGPQPLSIVLIDATGTAGTVRNLGGGVLEYHAPEGFVGDDTFKYVVTDGIAQADARVAVRVEPSTPTGCDEALVGQRYLDLDPLAQHALTPYYSFEVSVRRCWDGTNVSDIVVSTTENELLFVEPENNLGWAIFDQLGFSLGHDATTITEPIYYLDGSARVTITGHFTGSWVPPIPILKVLDRVPWAKVLPIIGQYVDQAVKKMLKHLPGGEEYAGDARPAFYEWLGSTFENLILKASRVGDVLKGELWTPTVTITMRPDGTATIDTTNEGELYWFCENFSTDTCSR
jgi:hypothetical protein